MDDLESYTDAIDQSSAFSLKGLGVGLKSELSLQSIIGIDFTSV